MQNDEIKKIINKRDKNKKHQWVNPTSRILQIDQPELHDLTRQTTTQIMDFIGFKNIIF